MSAQKSFIEVQFPVSKISKEAYKERKAGAGQTLTGLGKWWGRKPLILVRAALLGLLMPASDHPEKDREIFETILTLDPEGLKVRKNKAIPADQLFSLATPSEKDRYFDTTKDKATWKSGISNEDKQNLQEKIFLRLSYDEKLRYCHRPEEIDKLPEKSLEAINEYLGIKADSLQDIFQELGKKRFGDIPWVGDCFCGGGSIPFESARIGLNAFASDLNPIAMLLTWASLHLFSVSEKEAKELEKFQQDVFNEADKTITEWGIEHNEAGMRANSYLYCTETICPECGWKVPMAPSWVIGTKTKTVAILHPNDQKSFDIEIKSNASASEMKQAEQGTVGQSKLLCPHCGQSTPIAVLRQDRKSDEGKTAYGLRLWEKDEFLPRSGDTYQERLYCIRYEDGDKKRIYVAPSKADLQREQKVIQLLQDHFVDWQKQGYIPSIKIQEGDETTRLLRERGWQYWHQLFNPRQLLVHGLLMELIAEKAKTQKERVLGLLGVNRCSDWNSKLSRWEATRECILQTYYNQALNTLFNFSCRGQLHLHEVFLSEVKLLIKKIQKFELPSDARQITHPCHLWITDPPYADAVNYHELSEFFLAWDEKMLPQIFPDWYTDSKRALAVKGTGESFHQAMIQIYQNLTRLMPDDGMQIVMFTHQDVSVWADLTLILWSAGLRVTAAWNIATETESVGLKSGNYVKGTVLLVLRKQLSNETAFLDELYPEIEQEVMRQIDSMRDLDDKEEPNFYDPDYLLAAYAASLKVLTSYKKIEDIDISKELTRLQNKNSESPIEKIIFQAVKIAYDYLIPPAFDTFIWKMLSSEERFYLKSLDMEKEGITQLSAYQELARGFGVEDYRAMLASTKANEARLKTASEMGMRGIGSVQDFSGSLLRQVFASIHQGIKEEDPLKGKNWLRNEVPSYWSNRSQIQVLLSYLSSLSAHATMIHWHKEAEMARYILELVKNDTL
jgi:putative DNA methylase